MRFRYSAIPISGGPVEKGERIAETEAELRAALRQGGLRVIDVRSRREPAAGDHPVRRLVDRFRCKRRSPLRAELFDSLATLLESGLRLPDSLEAVADPGSPKAVRRAVQRVLGDVRAGQSLSDSAASQPEWFDEPTVAMLRAGEHSGELSMVLRTLAVTEARSGQLGEKLVGALAYPALIAVVGIGVTMFLGTRTLPELATMLTEAGVAVPQLTAGVIALCTAVATNLPVWLGIVLGIPLCVTLGIAWARRNKAAVSRRLVSAVPVLFRRLAVARVAAGVAGLTRCGVPLVEAVRVTIPTISGPGTSHLRLILSRLADRMESGDELGEVFEDGLWFDGEFKRLVVVGQSSGELPELLGRLAERLERRSRRAIDRLADLLQPAAILILAALVGVVVMAAVLPLIRLQDVL